MKFLVIIGKKKLYAYEQEENELKRQYIEGNPYYEYDIQHCKEDIAAFMEALANEKNLLVDNEFKFDILENTDQLCTKLVLNAMGEHVGVKYSITEVIKMLLERLAKDRTLYTDVYGINYDGASYRLEKGKLVQAPFDLLALTVHDEELINVINGNRR